MNRFLQLAGELIMFSGFTLFATTFIIAYNNPLKQATIDINTIGEANIEYAILLVMFVCSIFTLHRTYNEMTHGRERPENNLLMSKDK